MSKLSSRFSPHLAAAVFNTPLMIENGKLDAILAVLAPKIGLDSPATPFVDSGDIERVTRKPLSTSDGIAVIDVVGTLVHETNGAEPFSGMTPYQAIANDLDTAMRDTSVRGVLLRVDSSGGTANGAFDAADAIYEASKLKPMAAVAADVSASAAYLLASAAGNFFVTQSSSVGSIGVLSRHVDRSEMNAMLGIKMTYVTAGTFKAAGNPDEPLEGDALAYLQERVESTYSLFVEKVMTFRGLSDSAIRTIGARVYRGEEAVAVGLADGVMTERAALAWLKEHVAEGPRHSFQSQEKRAMKPNADAGSQTKLGLDAEITEDEAPSTQPEGEVEEDDDDEAGEAEGVVDENAEASPATDEDDAADSADAGASDQSATAIAAAQKLSTDQPDVAAALKQEGMKAERERITQLQSLIEPGEEDQLQGLIDQGCSVADAALQLADHRRTQKAARYDKTVKGRPQALASAPTDAAARRPSDKGGSEADDFHAEWHASSDLQAEFASAENYAAWKKHAAK